MRIFLAPDDGGGTIFDTPVESAPEAAVETAPEEVSQSDGTEQTVQENTETEAVKPAGWIAGLKKELQADPEILKYQTVSDIVYDWKTLKGRLEGSIKKPDESSSPEDVKAYRTAMGIPENPDGYEFPEDFGGLKMDPERVKQYSELAHKLNLTKEQAVALMEYEANTYREAIEHTRAAKENTLAAANKVLKETWGEEYGKNVKLATRAFNTFASKVDKEVLDKTGILNDPRFVIFLSKVGSAISEDSLVDGSPQSPGKKRGFITNYKET